MRTRRASRRTIAVAVLFAVGTVSLAGCANGSALRQVPSSAAPPATEQVAPGDIPDTQAYVVVRGPSLRWSLKVPEGWSQQQLRSGFRFTDKLNAVEAVERSATAAPTVASVRTSVVPALRSATAGFEPGTVSSVTRKVGPGVLLTYRFDSSKDPVTGRVHRDAAESYVFYRNGREVTVTLSGAVGADNVDPWRIVSDSFGWSR